MAATGSCIHVLGRTDTYTGRTGEIRLPQRHGYTSRGEQPRAQIEQGRHWDVHPRELAYSHVHMSNRRKMAATGTYIHVHWPTATCIGRTGAKKPPQGRTSTYRGLQPRAQVAQAKNGLKREVHPCTLAYSHVHRSNRRKMAATGTCIHIQGPTATCIGRTG